MNKKLSIEKLIAVLIIILPISICAQSAASSTGGSNMQMTLTHSDNNQLASPDEQNNAQWMHYDDIENFDSWGFFISGEEYDVVAKWDPVDLTNYGGWEITKIKFIVVNPDPTLYIKIWEGTNFTEVYSQFVSTFNVNAWTEIVLDTPVAIDPTQELYVGYHVDMTQFEFGGAVTATDDGPAVDDYGNLFLWNGVWYSDFNNHNLRVYIEPNLNAEFVADQTTVCYGSTVNFTNQSTAEESYLWTFEGGTPATSTDENPSVVYNTPGTYDVTLQVTLNSDTDTEVKTDYIHVLETPGQAEAPAGDAAVCTGQEYTYTIDPVLYAQEYEWEILPASAGILSPNDNSAYLVVADDWTGDFTLKVRATNICGDGEWSADFQGTVYQSPEYFNLEGEGTYCSETDGTEITLDGSQANVDYELFVDGETTGVIVTGTGSEISFGLFTDEGTYTCIAGNGDCSLEMSGQILVEIIYPPVAPAQPVGPDIICDETSSDYTSDGTDDADTYIWELSPDEAGTITSAGLDATVVWNTEFTGTAMVIIYGVNECGTGISSDLQVTVSSLPFAPATPTGPEVVCGETSSNYASEGSDNANSYEWELTPDEAGTITSSGLEATVEWTAGFAGMAYISLYGLNACGQGNSSETLEISVGEANPVIVGEDLVCDWSEETYSVDDNEGSTYTWQVTGGVITAGQESSTISVAWSGEGEGTVDVEETTAGGCQGNSETFAVIIDNCTGFSENNESESLKIYPNPVNEKLTINYTSSNFSNAELMITDLSGHILMTKKINGDKQTSIDLKSFSNGLFILSIKTESGRVINKQFIKR